MITNKQFWNNRSWFVTKLNMVYLVDLYDQLSRFQNHRHSAKYYVCLTFFEELNNIHDEYKWLFPSSSTVSHAAVAQAYFVQHKISKAMKMLASTDIRLLLHTMEAFGTILNSEHPHVLDSYSNERSRPSSMVKAILSEVDCRVFREFAKLNSLKNCSLFMSTKSDSDI